MLIDPPACRLLKQAGHQKAAVPPVIYKSFTGTVWKYGEDSPDFRVPDKRNHTWIRTNRVQTRRIDYATDPSAINEGFHLTGDELRVTTSQMINDALERVVDYYSEVKDNQRQNKPFAQWLDGWARVIRDFDGYSMGRFLREFAGLSDEAVEAIGTIENMTSRLHLAFFHSFLAAVTCTGRSRAETGDCPTRCMTGCARKSS